MSSSGFITIVSGLPRSGTSVMMQMLHAGGMPVLTDGLRPPDENNPRGFFEFEPVKRLRSDRSWLPQACGRAVKIIHLLLPELIVDGSLEYRIILMHRPIDEVLASQRAMLEREGKQGAPPELLKRTFESQLAQIESWLAARPAIRVMKVAHHEVISQPRQVAGELSGFLEMDLDVAAMGNAVDPALHRQRGQSHSPV